MKIRIESFRGYNEPATCQELVEIVSTMMADLKKDYPGQESLWWLNVYARDGEYCTLLISYYYQDGMEKSTCYL